MPDEPTEQPTTQPTAEEIVEAIGVAAQLEIDRRRAENQRAAPNN